MFARYIRVKTDGTLFSFRVCSIIIAVIKVRRNSRHLPAQAGGTIS